LIQPAEPHRVRRRVALQQRVYPDRRRRRRQRYQRRVHRRREANPWGGSRRRRQQRAAVRYCQLSLSPLSLSLEMYGACRWRGSTPQTTTPIGRRRNTVTRHWFTTQGWPMGITQSDTPQPYMGTAATAAVTATDNVVADVGVGRRGRILRVVGRVQHPCVGLALFHHVIVQSEHQSMTASNVLYSPRAFMCPI
jgi:hypothetical protein